MATYKSVKYNYDGSALTGITTDLTGINADIQMLAIREATTEASAAFNLPSGFIETFTDDTKLGTQTDGDRVASAGMWATMYSVTVAKPFYRAAQDEWDFTTAA